MSSAWDTFRDEPRHLPIQLPPHLAKSLYEIYLFYNEGLRKRMVERGDTGSAQDWKAVTEKLLQLAAEAETSETDVAVPLLLLNREYDQVLADFFGWTPSGG